VETENRFVLLGEDGNDLPEDNGHCKYNDTKAMSVEDINDR
jgi:hypothetical protein